MASETTVLARLLAACARHPWLTVLIVLVACGFGVQAARNAPLDAIPDLSETQVIVLTRWEGASPDLVEDQVTYPLSTALLSTPRVQSVRGQSFFGLSFVYVIFEEGTDLYWARSRVVEGLTVARDRLPTAAITELGPDASGVGWVFQYALVDRSGAHDLASLRAYQDFDLRYALAAVPGVAEVASLGGVEKAFEVRVDPARLRAFDVSISQVLGAIRAGGSGVGGHVIELGEHEHMVRARGYLTDARDIELLPVRTAEGGVPVLLGQVADVVIGPAARRGIAELNGEGEVVGGIVIMRQGANALTVINAVKERFDELKSGLPPGVEVVITYDRSELIEGAVGTLRGVLIEEMVVVGLVIVVFLMHIRSALVAIVTLPAAVTLAFIPMYYQGLTVNIMSLGGIAVAIGAMVDAAIILIENVHKHLEQWHDEGEPGERTEVMIRAMQEVGPTIFFSLLVLTVSFLPIFTLEATEGRLFKPLAFTKTYSMAFAALLAVTLTPALVVLLVRGAVRREDHSPLNRLLIAVYSPIVRLVVWGRWGVLALAGLAMLVTVPVALSLSTEFMPPLNEGSLLYMPASTPGMSGTEAARVLQAMDRELMSVPEVRQVFGKIGRADTATDPAPIDMVETTILLHPRDKWRPGLTWEALVAELDDKLRWPGMPNVWWMPIQTRTEMLATGVRSPLAVQVYGPDLDAIQAASIAIERAVSEVPGTRSAFAERSTGGFYLDIDVDRVAAARYGLSMADVHEVVQMAIGGMPVAETLDGRRRHPVFARFAPELREDLDTIGALALKTPTGAQVALRQVATLSTTMGPPMIRSEDGRLSGFVFIDPGERPVGDYVTEAKRAVAAVGALPTGVRVEWVGQYRYYERATERLYLVVPLTLLIVITLLWLNTGSAIETAIVLTAIPFSLIGAVWMLWLLDYHLSVAVWVGLIALAGLDAETGVVMLLYLTLAHGKAEKAGTITDYGALTEVIVDGAARRIRPKLMTVLTTMIGLTPLLWSNGTGADLMKRVAAPMVGGLVTSFFLELTVYPAIFAIWKGRALRR